MDIEMPLLTVFSLKDTLSLSKSTGSQKVQEK
jgi:hypothetical protein